MTALEAFMGGKQIKELRDRDWLRERYCDQGLTMIQIATLLNCSPYAVWTWIHKHGIIDGSKRPRRPALRDRTAMKKMAQEYTVVEIAKKLECNEKTVRKWLKKHGIKVRKPRKNTSKRRDEIKRRIFTAIPYSDGDFGVIANQAGCARSTAKHYIERYPELSQAYYANTVTYKGPPKSKARRRNPSRPQEKSQENKRERKAVPRKGTKKKKSKPRRTFKYMMLDREQLRLYYCEKEYAISELANLFTCATTTIIKALKYHNLKIRTLQEQMQTTRYREKQAKISSERRSSYDPEWDAKISKGVQKAWDRGDYGQEWLEKMASIQSPTSIEIEFCEGLNVLGIEHEIQYVPDGCPWIYDIFISPLLLIEINGDYWHNTKKAMARDKKKAEWSKRNGFKLITVWEHELKEWGAPFLINERIVPLLSVDKTLILR
jgi:G:T-mismatch repair DNA endonuclease (very short patch repair protein)/predicted DNA-binding protein YlxM (UPF0122 family)